MPEILIKRYSKNVKITERGNHIRLRIRSPNDFIKSSFITDDVGRPGFTKRIGGKLKHTKKWANQAWIFDKRSFGRQRAIAEAKKYAMRLRRAR